MTAINLFALLIFTTGYSAPIGLVAFIIIRITGAGGEKVLPEDDRGSVGRILVSTSVPALLIGGVIWVDGIPNNPSVLPTFLLSVALAWALVTAVYFGRLIRAPSYR